LMKAVQKEITRQLKSASRRELIERVLEKNTWLIEVANLEEGIELTNRLAPEHLEIMTRNAAAVAKKLVTAGAIFLGGLSPTVLGDYVAGPSHTLPSGGTGASFAGLTVDQFQRRTSLVNYNKSALKKASKTVQKFAEIEGLDAHGESLRKRLA
jgi:histidinol dehydrogenase